MPRTRKSEQQETTCAWCNAPVFCKGLCRRHYGWERYHMLNGHGHAYFEEYTENHMELAARGRRKAQQVPRRMSRAA